MDKPQTSQITEIAKAGVLAIALYVLWGAFISRIEQQDLRLTKLEEKIDLCNGEQRRELTVKLDSNTEALKHNNDLIQTFNEINNYDKNYK